MLLVKVIAHSHLTTGHQLGRYEIKNIVASGVDIVYIIYIPRLAYWRAVGRDSISVYQLVVLTILYNLSLYLWI